MKYVIAILLFGHGFAHLVGFVVPWKLAKMDEMPYRTTVLNGMWDIGDTGVKIYGLFWLLLSLAFFYAAYTAVLQQNQWINLSMIISVISLIFCALGWPDTKIGVFVNLILIVFLVTAPRFGLF